MKGWKRALIILAVMFAAFNLGDLVGVEPTPAETLLVCFAMGVAFVLDEALK